MFGRDELDPATEWAAGSVIRCPTQKAPDYRGPSGSESGYFGGLRMPPSTRTTSAFM